ncbi:partner of Y14 and mago-like [Melia azedarach]|uniref:Partner of Y14 and mago-like n=1 Tax=Melia azedarach TaxID=155640 RepID=A0ACC1Y1H9_MELAZ|nr:partner of Y14 and mago-like [Melia azedarach]
MAGSNGGGGGGEEDELRKMAELSKTLKEGERIVAPTRRPDGTLRKPIRIRAGYVPQEEVAKYQSKGALLKKELMALQEVPPGYDPVIDAKSKTKSEMRNERKKEKRLQAALAKGKNIENTGDGESKKEEALPAENLDHGSASAKSLMSQMNELYVSSNAVLETLLSDAKDTTDVGAPGQDIDKRIRALKKKEMESGKTIGCAWAYDGLYTINNKSATGQAQNIRLAEVQQQKTGQQELKPEQLEKFSKLEGWREELKLLEDKKAELAAL